MEEARGIKGLVKELREVLNELRRERTEAGKEMKEIKERLEKIEKKQAVMHRTKESEWPERKTEKIEKKGEDAAAKEASGKERVESSDGGWSDVDWGKKWWEGTASEEEERSVEGGNSSESEAERRREESEDRKDRHRTEERNKEKALAEGKSRLWRKTEEREEEVKKRREWKMRKATLNEEKTRKEEEEKRKRTLIWRRASGQGPEERREFVEALMERVTGRMTPIRRCMEVTGEDGEKIIFMELEEKEDKEEIMRRSSEIWRRWEIGVDEYLTIEERAYRHRMVKKAKEERKKGRSVIMTNKRIWIDGREAKWDERRGVWWRPGKSREEVL